MPISVSAYLEGALYGTGTGFYETGGRAGRRGDFLTSPEVGPLFGVLVARALDRWWEDLGRPDPFTVHEHGAGPGTLARGVVQAGPACGGALRWALVERAAAQRALHPDHLPHLGDLPAEGAASPWWLPGGGPLVASAAGPPAAAPHVVVANELLDNLPFDLAERTDAGWDEILLAPPAAGDEADEVTGPLDRDRAAALDTLVPGAPVGARVPLQDTAARWLRSALDHVAPGGRVVVLDYGATTPELAARPWRSWVRTYRGQERGGHPFAGPGSQDVTVEVALDQLTAVAGAPEADRDQATALREWGLDALVDEARAAPAELAGPDALAALRLRSRIREAEALVDPAGLGAFRVWEWVAPAPR